MKNKRCFVDQRINGHWTYQRTTEVMTMSAIIFLSDLQIHNSFIAARQH
jgi:hypothetical protein